MKSAFDQIFNDVIEPFFAPRIRKGSIKAVKAYVASIQVARKIALTAFALGAVSAVAVTGLILVIVAVIGLLPITPTAALISILVLGLLLTGVSSFVAYQGFAEKKWLEYSKSYELMEAAMGRWDNSLVPPDPRKILGADEAMSQTKEPTAYHAPSTQPFMVP